MPTGEEQLFERLAEGFLEQSTVEAAAIAGFVHVPQQELPPELIAKEQAYFRELWDKYHPKPPSPPPTPDMLGPWYHPIGFSGGTPVGGWAQVTVRKNGDWHFTGHLRDSGLPSYDDGVVCVVKNIESDEIYQFVHRGRMHGTLESGSRNDDWDEQGNNTAVSDGWDSLCRGYAGAWRCEVNPDINSIIKAAEQAVGDAAKIIAML